jgi:hypothetical protein
MPKLHLPEGADRILTRIQDLNLPREGSKLLVYGLADEITAEDVESLCHIATETYQLNEAADQHQNSTFIMPAPLGTRLPGRSVQEILDVHVASLISLTIINEDQHEIDESIYPFAFIVLESAFWHNHGATIVFLDNDYDPDDDDDDDRPPEGRWWVDECETSVFALVGLCCDLVLEQDDWPNIRECQGRPTARTGSARYVATRSRSWSASKSTPASILKLTRSSLVGAIMPMFSTRG